MILWISSLGRAQLGDLGLTCVSAVDCQPGQLGAGWRGMAQLQSTWFLILQVRLGCTKGNWVRFCETVEEEKVFLYLLRVPSWDPKLTKTY